MPVVERSLVSDQVFRHLAADIIAGRYGPGEKLPTQRALAADLGVNMASIREAVKRLEQMRLIEVRQGDAMRVRDWREHGTLDVIAHLVLREGELDGQTIMDVLEARRLMLIEVARLAAERRTADQSRQLQQLAERIADADDAQSAQNLDWSFYTELTEAARNIVFTLVMNSIRELYFQSAALFRPLVDEYRQLAPLYRKVAGAVEAGDAGLAAKLTDELAGIQEERLRAALNLGGPQ